MTDPSVEPSSPETEREPMSLAEEIAEEVREGLDVTSHYEALKKGDPSIASLQKLSMQELVELARQEQIGDVTGAKKQDIVFRILKERIKLNGLMFGEGTLEILPDGFGFLRSADFHYLSCPDDIYVSPSQIRRFGLRNGMSVAGQIRPPKESERYFALLRVEAINGEDPAKLTTRVEISSAVVSSWIRSSGWSGVSSSKKTRVVSLAGSSPLIASTRRSAK